MESSDIHELLKESPHKRPVIQSFDIAFVVSLIKPL